ncbi:hypothetical protein CA13_26220 [Planctomycetes bacterium CA13]|uniref:Uncharacterized protein n=1 Tax=Novipirellula herctigrandis TaxID=2527986 RepID=A0A5C5Z1I7_9BACT|nr:hypothetical protein CA13_26220 [Planctomycetes bacterium CA13]
MPKLSLGVTDVDEVRAFDRARWGEVCPVSLSCCLLVIFAVFNHVLRHIFSYTVSPRQSMLIGRHSRPSLLYACLEKTFTPALKRVARLRANIG